MYTDPNEAYNRSCLDSPFKANSLINASAQPRGPRSKTPIKLDSKQSQTSSYISFKINSTENVPTNLSRPNSKAYTVLKYLYLHLQVYHIVAKSTIYEWTISYRFSELKDFHDMVSYPIKKI